MPPKDSKDSKALTMLRRARTEPIMSIARVGTGTDFSLAMTRMILRNIHLAFLSRRNEVIELNATENSYAPEQRDGAEPVIRTVRVAVKPGIPKSRVDQWDDSIGFDVSSKSDSKFRGLTSSKRSKKPPFVFKEIPYNEWRKHYAKDKFGRYRGTEAPAEDTILVPEDEVKWRSAPDQTEADQMVVTEEISLLMKPVERSATLPEHQAKDLVVPLQPEQAPAQAPAALAQQQEEAIFVDETGHTFSRIVQETKVGQA